MSLYGYLNENGKYSDSFRRELENRFTMKEFSKGDHLYRQGDLCRHLFFIKKGIVRIYRYTESGKDVTLWFSSEDFLFTAIDCFYLHKPSNEFCEALEDVIVHTITHSQLEALLSDKRGAEIAFYMMYDLIRIMADHFNVIRFLNAEERYKDLVKKHPGALQRISLGHIASYLGITQETLSRIRAKK